MDNVNVRQGATVYSSDGEKLGKVVAAEGQYIVVEKGFFFPTDYYVPYSAIASAEGDDVYLSATKDEALNSGWDQIGTYDTDTTTLTGTATTADFATSGNTAVDAAYGSRSDRAASTGATTTDQDTLRIPVHEEELTATTRPVAQGEVRIGKDVVEEERTLEVPVTEERVRVSRRAVDRDAAPDAAAFAAGEVAVPVRGEAVDVQKRTRVAEEVEVGKEAVRRTERVADTVRKEQVRVEDATTEGGHTEHSHGH